MITKKTDLFFIVFETTRHEDGRRSKSSFTITRSGLFVILAVSLYLILR